MTNYNVETYYQKTDNHMTVGTLVRVLSSLPPNIILHAGEYGLYPEAGLHSYRGYYEDMEIEASSSGPITVGEFLDSLNSDVGSYIEAHKGGQFLVSPDCYLWVGREGTCRQQALTGVRLNADGSAEFTLAEVSMF